MEKKINDDVVLRNVLYGDAAGLTKNGDNVTIAINQRDCFPSPYTIEYARMWIHHVREQEVVTRFALATKKEAIGEIGYQLQVDVHRNSAEISFWIGEEYWGHGIVTKAINYLCNYAFKEQGVKRLFADVLEYNIASQKALIKCGFRLEAVLEKNIYKHGMYYDQYVYAKLDDEHEIYDGE